MQQNSLDGFKKDPWENMSVHFFNLFCTKIQGGFKREVRQILAKTNSGPWETRPPASQAKPKSRALNTGAKDHRAIEIKVLEL